MNDQRLAIGDLSRATATKVETIPTTNGSVSCRCWRARAATTVPTLPSI